METSIQPEVIKKLMKKKRLTQQALAHEAGLSIATIKRICSGTETVKGQRLLTLSKLAKALGVSEAVLAGTEPLDEEDEKDEHLKSRMKFKASISRQNDLSFQAVEAIYGISRSAQVAMAPLFAALIAEASLKWRQERLDALGLIADRLDAVRGDNPILNEAFSYTWEAEKIEQQSIAAKDVMGRQALKELDELSELAGTGLGLLMDHDVPNKLPHEVVSPFLAFLHDFASSFAGSDIKVELEDEDGNPQMPTGVADYRVGGSLFASIIGQSVWAKLALEFGHVSLADIPSDLKDPAKREELVKFFRDRTPHEQRVAWAQEQLEMYKQFRVAGMDPLIATPELINDLVKRLEDGELS